LAALLQEAQTEPKRRAKTRLNRVGKTERLKVKKVRGTVKANRGKPSSSDW
jgi:ribosome-associated protein